MKKCTQVNCSEPASWTYVWPGRPSRDYVCAEHLFKAASVANAAGFNLGDVRVLTLDELLDGEHVHARGFPHFGPPTLCGEGDPPREVVTEVTCPKCLEILCTEDGLTWRIKILEAEGVRVRVEEIKR